MVELVSGNCLRRIGGSMPTQELFWIKFAAIAQAIGALATFAAVLASLKIANDARRPLLKPRVAEWRVVGAMGETPPIVWFEAANVGHMPVRITGIVWQTGWLRFGPRFLRQISAHQVTGALGYGRNVPFDIAVAEQQGTCCLLENLLNHAKKRAAEPIFCRDWPIIGRRATRVRLLFLTATGHALPAKIAPELLRKLVEAECSAHPRVAVEAKT